MRYPRVVQVVILSWCWSGLSLVSSESPADESGPHPTISLPDLSPTEALEGWLALFDGKTTFGFRDARLISEHSKSVLRGGETTTEFGDCELRIRVLQEGNLYLGDWPIPLRPGHRTLTVRDRRGTIRLGDGLVVESLSLKPSDLQPLWNGRDLTGWDRRGRVPKSEQSAARWQVEEGVLHVVGGPEALEYAPAEGAHLFDDFVVQLVVRTRKPGANGGFFFRNQPGKTMMGYEAQLHNPWYDPASKKHGYTTGGIDDRQQARAPVAVDGQPFRMTVITHGPHIATWVNGYQTVDWTDTRPMHENPRRGQRLAAGTIQLQAHDPESDLEFHGIWLREL